MDKLLIKQKVDDIIEEVFCLDELDEYGPNTSLVNDLQADSLDVVDIIYKLENEFHISISEKEINFDSCNIQNIYDYVISKVS